MLVLLFLLFVGHTYFVLGQYAPISLHGICDLVKHEEEQDRLKARIEFEHGPNVCGVEEVIGSGKQYHSECLDLGSKLVCEKSTFTRFRCCAGFEMTSPNAFGCQRVRTTTNLFETASDLYLVEFIKFTKRSQVKVLLNNKKESLTVFAPQNKAFRSIDKPTKRSLSAKNSSTLLYHMIRGRHYVGDLFDNAQINTLYKDGQQLRVNRYANGVVTVNCARIVVGNTRASNGILHEVEKVITPIPRKESTIADILLKDIRLVDLAAAVFATDMGNILRSPGPFTFFASTAEAFQNLPSDIKTRILDEKDLLLDVLLHHTLNESICSAAILGPATLRTLQGQKVVLSCDFEDSFTINDVPTQEADIVASNGVIHIIDELFIPDSVRTLRLVMNELALDQFSEYARLSGLEDILDGFEKGNYTFFAPSEDAFATLSDDQLVRIQTDQGFMNRVFNYHVVDRKLTTGVFIDDTPVTTKSSRELDHLTLKVYQTGYGVNSANIVSANNIAGKSVVHVIDRVLLPPPGSIVDILKADPNLRSIMGLLQDASMDVLLETSGPFTLFAPINDALDQLTVTEPNRRTFLNYHIVRGAVYTSAMAEGLIYKHITLTDDRLRMRQEVDDEPMLVDKQANILQANIEATNGVVHVIASALRAPALPKTGNEI